VIPAFIIATELHPHAAQWAEALAQLHEVQKASARVLGFEPALSLASMPGHAGDAVPSESKKRRTGAPGSFSFSPLRSISACGSARPWVIC
jgi:hypothetical protein